MGEIPVQPLPWQSEQWHAFTDRLDRGRLAHAWLLRGASGVGKQQFAKAFAALALCETRDQLKEACGFCRGCRLMQSGNHPDYMLLAPEQSGKAIKIDQIRQLTRFTEKTALRHGRRVIIISPAEQMNLNAANALLKCLEEPAGDTLFMLVSSQLSLLLPTIRSRCQQMVFPVPSVDDVKNWLIKQDGISESIVASLLDMAGGRPFLALEYAGKEVQAQRQLLIEGLQEVSSGRQTPVEIAMQWQDVPQERLIGWIQYWLYLMTCYMVGDRCSLQEQEQEQDGVKMLTYVATKAGSRNLIVLHDWLLQQQNVISRGMNLNRQLFCEQLLIRWLHLTVN